MGTKGIHARAPGEGAAGPTGGCIASGLDEKGAEAASAGNI